MKNIFSIITLLVLLASCGKEANVSENVTPLASWLIPQEEVFDAGPGKDGIPSVDDPQFNTASEVNNRLGDRLLLGMENNNTLKAYPIPILDWHEIVNDEIGGLPIAITYCPLTGTGIGWGRQLVENGFITTYGVSGLLYNSNLMPYDRQTGSTWSQQRLECVNGTMRGTKPQLYPLIETTFDTWKKAFPNSMVMNGNTGFDREYAFYPYGNYLFEDEQLFFPVSNLDKRMPFKERVLGIIGKDNTQVKVYRFQESGTSNRVIHDTFDGNSIIIVQSVTDNYNLAFLNPENLQFEAVDNQLPIILKDDQGGSYDLLGRKVNTADGDSRLEQPISFMGFWFSWAAFYPEVEVY